MFQIDLGIKFDNLTEYRINQSLKTFNNQVLSRLININVS